MPTSWVRNRLLPAPKSASAPDSALPSQHLENRGIPHALSVYLDLVRFLAAVSVVLYHTWKQFFPDSHVKWPGHEAVVVFFVLSGYVIAHTASRPGISLSVYLQHRIARIVPVAWMALALGFVLSIPKGELPFQAVLVNMVFLGQSGLWWTEAPINPPFWSLNYEVWYYLIFAAWMFSPAKYRKLLTALAALIAGPKILLLFPVWLMGVWLYRRMPTLQRGQAVLMYASTLVAASLLCWLDVSDSLRSWLYHVCPPAWRLHYSTQFIYDTLLGIVVTAHFAAAAVLAPSFRWLIHFEKPIRYLAGFSFSIYVFHAPLGELYYAGMNPVLFYAELAVCMFLLAQVTERRVAYFRRLANRLSRQPSAIPSNIKPQ